MPPILTQVLGSRDVGQPASVDLILAEAGVALAIPGVLQVCWDALDRIREFRGRLNSAANNISDLHVSLELHEAQIRNSLCFIKDISPTLDEINRLLLVRVVDRLQLRLTKLRTVLESYQTGRFDDVRFTYSEAKVKYHLEQVRDWQRDFDSFVVSLVYAGGAQRQALSKENKTTAAVERIKKLRNTVTDCLGQNPNGISETSEQDFPSTGESIRYTRISLGANSHVDSYSSLIEYRQIDASTHPDATRLVATALHSAEEGMGLLKCQGYRQDRLLFGVPEHFDRPSSLREVLIDASKSSPKHALNQRFRLITQLATALTYVHTAGLVHKSFRPDSILILQHRSGDKSGIGEPFLLGFDLSRKADGRSQRQGVDEFEKNIYLHPDRQGSRSLERYYSQRDDVYSFGVVALEVALWTSFAEQPESSSEGLVRARIIRKKDAEEVKRKFLEAATNAVPPRMGQTLSDLLIDCLTCLDDAKTGTFGRDKVAVGDEESAEIMNHIVRTLSEISL